MKYWNVYMGFLLLSATAFLLYMFAPALHVYRFDEASIEAQVRSLGGKAAYEAFAEANSSIPRDVQHTNAHFFGTALYKVEGLDGLSVCDGRFAYGCYHEFLGHAIADHGLSSVTDLAHTCTSVLSASQLSCLHGVGHGVLSYVGYSRESLDRALSTCDRLTEPHFAEGCYGGVFMEYNMRVMLTNAGGLRKDRDQFAPCDTLDQKYGKTCAFALPQWWRQSSLVDVVHDVQFKKIGTLCHTLPVSSRRSCFEGTGVEATSDAFDPVVTKRLCELSSSDPLEQLFCKSFGANSMLGVGGSGKEIAEKVCDGLKSNSLVYCLAYARNQAHIYNQLPTPNVL